MTFEENGKEQTFIVSSQLYGEKWKSPMPRFAANLGYNPLEPLKPTTVDPSQSAIYASNKSKGAMPRDEHLVAEVPAAQFDWNSAGLVNPLDGKPDIFVAFVNFVDHFEFIVKF